MDVANSTFKDKERAVIRPIYGEREGYFQHHLWKKRRPSSALKREQTEKT